MAKQQIPPPHADRLARLRAAMVEKKLDAYLVQSRFDQYWLTGFTGEDGAALVTPANVDLLTDGRFDQTADLEAPWATKLVRKKRGPEFTARLIKRRRAGRIGFDPAQMTVGEFGALSKLIKPARLVAAAGVISQMRQIKDAGEIDAIRAAARLADAAFEEIVGAGIVGRTERAVALDLEIAMRRRGAEAASFAPIVAAGPHGALPHAVPRAVPIPAGTLVVIDWGAQLDGYASDCTRTVATGELDPRDRAVYDLVLRAQEAALAAVRPGPTGKEVDALARAIIDEAGHAEHFGHGLGHGVGLEVHEGPRLSKIGTDTLAAGNIVTVEPGVYVPGAVGVRIEDLVAITTDGHEVLSGLPKTLRVVG